MAKVFRLGTRKSRSENFDNNNNVTKIPGLKSLTIKSQTPKQGLSSDRTFLVCSNACELTYVVMPVVVVNVFGTDNSGIKTFYQICLRL